MQTLTLTTLRAHEALIARKCTAHGATITRTLVVCEAKALHVRTTVQAPNARKLLLACNAYMVAPGVYHAQ